MRGTRKLKDVQELVLRVLNIFHWKVEGSSHAMEQGLILHVVTRSERERGIKAFSSDKVLVGMGGSGGVVRTGSADGAGPSKGSSWIVAVWEGDARCGRCIPR